MRRLNHDNDMIMAEIASERCRQDARFGEQNHADGTSEEYRSTADAFKRLYEVEKQFLGDPTWTTILLEETYETVTETDTVRLRQELIQVAAVACAWIDALDRREASEPTTSEV